MFNYSLHIFYYFRSLFVTTVLTTVFILHQYFLLNFVSINKQNHQTHLIYCVPRTCLLSLGSTVLVGLGLLCEFPRSLLDTRHSVGILWTGYRPVAETSARQHTTFTRDRHLCPPVGFEPAIPASERSQTHALNHATTACVFIR